MDLSRLDTKMVETGILSGGALPAKPMILLVEDTPETMEMIKIFLRSAGDVHCATDGDTALAMTSAGGRPYDVILMDINLGKGKSGIDVTKELRAEGMHRETPIIAITAYAMKGDREQVLASGCTDYLSKPFSKGELIETLKKYIAV